MTEFEIYTRIFKELDNAHAYGNCDVDKLVESLLLLDIIDTKSSFAEMAKREGKKPQFFVDMDFSFVAQTATGYQMKMICGAWEHFYNAASLSIAMSIIKTDNMAIIESALPILLRKGLDINQDYLHRYHTIDKSVTLLEESLMNNRTETVRYLIELGSEVKAYMLELKTDSRDYLTDIYNASEQKKLLEQNIQIAGNRIAFKL